MTFPSEHPETEFALSPALTLPPSFGIAHVGETFACTLCANNEVSIPEHGPTVTGVSINAVMQTPSEAQGIPLDLESSDSPAVNDSVDLIPSETIQRIVRFDLKEDGPHVLAVTVSYTEDHGASEDSEEPPQRTRTFRKLYQFAAQQLLSVRTKTQLLPPPKRREGPMVTRHALEAQLENLGDEPVVLEDVALLPKAAFWTQSLNSWELAELKDENDKHPVLNPREILQICFLLQERDEYAQQEHSQTRDGRTILGQLSIRWRSSMGDLGSLSTGWLSSKKR